MVVKMPEAEEKDRFEISPRQSNAPIETVDGVNAQELEDINQGCKQQNQMAIEISEAENVSLKNEKLLEERDFVMNFEN